MKSRDFVYWLQGFFEMGGADNGITPDQAAMIKRHLGLVFQNDGDVKTIPTQYQRGPHDYSIQSVPMPFPGQPTLIC
jgi:hypothetical protein